ncbi:MAG TPA: 3-oxoacyl-[acyl-carrier-protein] reductase [Candidatus Acidoferrales bacterium]|nr:3-oxoacyl-[acyl-carrier-protein] reductase [Candidatus Acidoferrales bacterium]
MNDLPMFSLKDKVALVTGASQGIGRATALALAQTGARVALAARNETKLAELAAQITATGGEALPVPMDLAQPEQIKSGFESVRAKFGGLHILVNNAAVTRDGLSIRMKPEDWDAVIQVNLTAAHIAIQHALALMLRQKWGRIINVSSVVAETGNAGQANYVAAKAGLIGLTKAIAVEVASRNITVNAVAPGFIVSPMTDPLSQQVKDALLARIPLGRMGRDQEVAAAIAFLASEEASYITGHVLDVNGGMYMA